MKLSYRGVSYEYNPPVVETTDSTATGKYRGLDWRFRNLKKPPILQPTHNLTYRGVRYQSAGVPARATEAAEVPVRSTQEKARSLMLDRQRTLKNRQHAMLSRSAAEIGLSLKAS